MNESTQLFDFAATFEALTGYGPFPWQQSLYDRFAAIDIPTNCNLPTGMGKTSVIAVWLIALANCPGRIPRRLVYVVNRRTVVDQTTDEVERLRARLTAPEKYSDDPRPVAILKDLAAALSQRSATGANYPLAISTLRGQFADNREWSADPSRPAVVCGTVDMIGSRLLFEGYGIGFKSRPLHAGFLGQDALLVHDEAHLEPAFQELIETITAQQKQGEKTGELPWPKLRVMALTATSRGGGENGICEKVFGLTPEENNPPKELPSAATNPIHHVWRRLNATKQLRLKQATDDGKIAEEIASLALERRWVTDENGGVKEANAAVLIFVRTLEDVKIVCERLTDRKTGVGSDHIQQLTGTMRGRERDRMADPRQPGALRVFARFLKAPKPNAPEDERWRIDPMPGTVYLVCTSAGEVGIDISADHMVCDLTTFESMAQRFGRVNRYGDRTDTRIDVVYPATFGKIDKKTGELKADEIDKRRQKTLSLLRLLRKLEVQENGEPIYDASPKVLGDLRQRPDLPFFVEGAFAPKPTIVPATDILFDAWALTSIRDPIPGRPAVEPYLHGIADWQPPETHVAWRQEVGIITRGLLDLHPPEELLDDYPLKPHELLRDRSDRVFKELEALAKRRPNEPVWVVDGRGAVEVTNLADLADKKEKDRINGCTVLLSPSAGGLTGGMLDGSSKQADDVADVSSSSTGARIRVWSDDPDYDRKTRDMRRVRSIEIGSPEEDEAEPRHWDWYERLPLEGGRTAKKPVSWKTHVDDVVEHTRRIVVGLSLPQEIADLVILAAKLHDHGKKRERFQATLGNRNYPAILLAKSGRKGARLPEPFRHEFASILDARDDPEFQKLTDEMKDLVLHLIAAHHGRARPHFDRDEAFDPNHPQSDADALAIETPRRFARLQRKYGRWGLAYLESLLRAADWAASAVPSAYLEEAEAKL